MSRPFANIFLAITTALSVGAAVADEHGHAHPHFPPDIDAFHSLLAPIWHARPGRERTRNVCTKAGELEKSAQEIHSTDATVLVASIARLKSTCKGKRADVDAAFFDVHEAFHHLIEAPSPVSAR